MEPKKKLLQEFMANKSETVVVTTYIHIHLLIFFWARYPEMSTYPLAECVSYS